MSIVSFAAKLTAVAMLASTFAASAYALPLPASADLGSSVVKVDSTNPHPSPYHHCWTGMSGKRHCSYQHMSGGSMGTAPASTDATMHHDDGK
jgi:hypothetical protein